MSLINDALKRAQEERLAPPGGLPGVPVYQKAPERALRREIGLIVLLVLLVVLLFGGLVGILVYLRLRPAPAPAPTPPAVAIAAPTATATAAASEPAAAPGTPQSRYGKVMRQAKTIAGQVADVEQDGRETANALGAPPAPPVAPSAPPLPAAAPPPLAPATTGTPAVVPPPALPAAPAAPVYKLSGIIGRAPTFTALINGQMVKVKERVGTAELISLEATRAVLREADGKTVELTISGNR